MLIPCEIGVKIVLPAIRGLLARTIVDNYEMKERQAAKILGLSQSAISRYRKRNRGNTIIIENEPEVQALIDQLINLLISKPQQKMESIKLFCQACKMIREKGLMCKCCQEKRHVMLTEKCTFCR